MREGHTVQGVRVPWLIYGTAWKEDRTEALVRQALAAGCRAIDTANQRKHYVEAAVGAALVGQVVARADLFLQTKFTYRRGQDDRLPYDPTAPLAEQVRQSFDLSCQHLGTDRLDAYLLHGPWAGHGWAAEDREVWTAMEAQHRAGRVALLGVSNIELDQLRLLCAQASVAPALVQNRCYARTGWDREVRAFCRDHGLLYQGFSLLTANRRELAAAAASAIARRLAVTVAELVFAFAAAIGIVPLTGTSDPAHLAADLAAGDLELGAADVRALEHLVAP